MNPDCIRLACNDVARLQELNRLFGDVFQDGAYTTHPPSDAYLADFLSSRDHVVIVARDGEVIIGGLVGYVVPKFEQNRSELYVYDLAVRADRQGQGIGRALIESVRREAGHIGAYVVFLQADEGDAAIEFYRRLGPAEDQATRNFDFTPRNDPGLSGR